MHREVTEEAINTQDSLIRKRMRNTWNKEEAEDTKTYIHAYIHTYIYTYIHTNLHTGNKTTQAKEKKS